jgi:hypothetical protein
MMKKLNKLLKVIVGICKIIILLINLIINPYILALTYAYGANIIEVLGLSTASFVLYILIHIISNSMEME